MKEAWKTVDKNTYYFDRTGTAYTGPHTISGKIYIFRTDGKLANATGLVTIDGNTYYCDNNGHPQTGYKKIKDAYYYFGTDGVMYRKNGHMWMVISSISAQTENVR